MTTSILRTIAASNNATFSTVSQSAKSARIKAVRRKFLCNIDEQMKMLAEINDEAVMLHSDDYSVYSYESYFLRLTKASWLTRDACTDTYSLTLKYGNRYLDKLFDKDADGNPIRYITGLTYKAAAAALEELSCAVLNGELDDALLEMREAYSQAASKNCLLKQAA